MIGSDPSAVRKPLMGYDNTVIQEDNSDCCSCTRSWVKTFLIFFTAIILIIALALLSLGSYFIIMRLSFVPILVGEVAYVNHFLLFVIGILLIIACVIGFVGVSKKDVQLLTAYAGLLTCVLLVQIATGILALCYSELFQDWFALRLRTTMQTRYTPVESDIFSAVDHVQQKFKCCGSTGYNDWRMSSFQNSSANTKPDFFGYGIRTPDSCCIRRTDDCGFIPHPSNIYHQGCIYSIFNRLRDRYYIICVVVLTLIAVELTGVLLACCYAQALKQQR